MSALLGPVRAAVESAERKAESGFMERNPGKSIFSSPRAPKLDLSTAPIRSRSASGFEIRVRGMAALIETGGRTRPKKIRARTGRLLAFDGRAGRVFAREVNHPGSRIAKQGTTEKAVKELERTAPAMIDRALQEQVRARGLD